MGHYDGRRDPIDGIQPCRNDGSINSLAVNKTVFKTRGHDSLAGERRCGCRVCTTRKALNADLVLFFTPNTDFTYRSDSVLCDKWRAFHRPSYSLRSQTLLFRIRLLTVPYQLQSDLTY